MKKLSLSSLALLVVGLLFGSASQAQDYSRPHLPDGALLRLGKGRAEAAVYSADRTRLAVSSSTGIWIYDARSHAELALLPQTEVAAMALSPDGSKVICIAKDNYTVEVWDTASERLISDLRPDRQENGIWLHSAGAFSPSGSTIATGSSEYIVDWLPRTDLGSEHAVLLWNAESGELEAILHGHEERVWAVAYSPDATTLASGGDDNTVRLWDVASGDWKAILEGHAGGISVLAYSPDGTTLASGSWDTSIRLWDVASGKLITTLVGHDRGIQWLSFSPDGTTLVSGGWDGIRLWDGATGELQDTMEFRGLVLFVPYTPDGASLVIGHGHSPLELWDLATGQVDYFLPEHTTKISSLAFSPDGSILASGHRDGLRLWDTADGQLRTIEGSGSDVRSVEFSPDGSLLAFGSSSVNRWPTVELWEVAHGELQRTLYSDMWGVNALAFSPDGTILASGRQNGLVKLWDVTSGQLTAVLGHPTRISSLSFSPDGSTLASACWEEGIWLWEAATSVLSHTIDAHRAGTSSFSIGSLAFSPDGSTLAAANRDNSILLLDAVSGQLRDILEGLTHAQKQALETDSWELDNRLTSVAYSPGGSTVAAAGTDGRILVWDVASARLRETLEGYARGRHVAFSPAEAILASGHTDGTILLWGIEPLAAEPGEDQESMAVPIGFDVEKWSWQEPISLDIITNPEYGTGLVGTTVREDEYSDAEVLLWRYSARGRELISRIPARRSADRGHTVRFDRTGLFGNKLFVLFNVDGKYTRLVAVEPTGGYNDVVNIDGNTARVALEFNSQPGYPAGACIWRGLSVYWLGESLSLHEAASRIEDPVGRSYIRPIDVKSDPTGRYDGLLTLSDTEIDYEGLSGLYQLQADGELRTLVAAASVTEHQFQGIDFSNAGPLGSALYVADAATGNIWIVSPRGDIEAFALGFSSPKRIAIGAQGTEMWVTDDTGLYRIFSTDPSDGVATAVPLGPDSPAMTGGGVTALQSNHPNPFNASTRIPYRLASPGPVRLVIFNALGQPVRTLVDEFQVAGPYVVPWDGRDDRGRRVANGAYLYRLQARAQVQVRRMVVLE